MDTKIIKFKKLVYRLYSVEDFDSKIIELYQVKNFLWDSFCKENKNEFINDFKDATYFLDNLNSLLRSISDAVIYSHEVTDSSSGSFEEHEINQMKIFEELITNISETTKLILDDYNIFINKLNTSNLVIICRDIRELLLNINSECEEFII